MLKTKVKVLSKAITSVLFLLFFVLSLSTSVARAEVIFLDKESMTELLSSKKGKVVVVTFFASWCPPCLEEIPTFNKFKDRYSDKDFVFVPVSLDEVTTEDGDTTPKALLNLISNYNINYQVYRINSDFAVFLGIDAIPKTLIVNKEGKVVFSEDGVISESKIFSEIDKLIEK